MRTAQGTPPEHRLTRPDALALLAVESADLDRRTAALDVLQADETYLDLRANPPRGLTGQRWAAARQAADATASMLGKWRRILADVARLLQEASRPGVDLARVETLLRGDSVPLAPTELRKPDRRPPGATSTEPQFSLAAVRGLIDSDLRLVRHAVADVRAVRQAARPRLVRLAAGLDGIRAEADPVTEADVLRRLDAAVDQLDRLTELVVTDPLALLGGPAQPTAGLDPAPFHALAALLADLDGRLAATVARRGELADRVARIGRAVDDLAARESHARDRRNEVLLRAAPAWFPASPRAAGPLRTRLRAVEGALSREPQAAPGELDAIERALATALQDAEGVTAWATAPLPDHARSARCARPDCAGGDLDEVGICETCDRAPARPARPVAGQAAREPRESQ